MRHLAIPLALLVVARPAAAADALEIVRAAVEHWRGLSSQSEITMVIHRPDWERSMTIVAWTEGNERSLVRVTEPARDRGNATLVDGDNMWTFSPKVNRVIKLPSSMMSQSWMGSDFSNKDISRADDIIDQYVHNMLEEKEADGHALYVIESVPLEEAAVVWGKEVLTIRDDHIVLEHAFYDQDGELVKSMSSLEVGELGGRTVAIRQRMQKVDVDDEWTEIRLDAVEYDVELSDNLFTLSSLRNPRN